MNQTPISQLPTNRSVSGVQHTPATQKNTSSFRPLKAVKNFLSNVGSFFRKVFFGKKAAPSNASATGTVSNQSTEVSKKSSEDSNQSTEVSKKSQFYPKLQQRFGNDPLPKLQDKMSSLGLHKDFKNLVAILNKPDASAGASIDGYLAKIDYHTELHQLVSVTSDKESVLQNSSSMESLKSNIESLQKNFISEDGKLTHSSSDYQTQQTDLQQLVHSFRSDLKAEISSSESSFRRELSSIKESVLKSTETYVKSGEFDQKQLVSKLYQSSTKLLNYAIGKRESSITSIIKQNMPNATSDQISETFTQLKELFAEKHFHLMASTIKGDQYLKGWESGGRSDAEIMSDVSQLLGGNQSFVNDVAHSFDSLLTGLDHKIQESSHQLIQAAHQNDSMMASMKTIHEMTIGFEKFVDHLGSKDFSEKSLDSMVSDLKSTYKMMSNFKSLSTDFVVGEHSLTHMDDQSIRSMVMDMIPQNQFSSHEDKADFVSKMTLYIKSRLESKGALDSESNDYGTIHQEKLSSLELKDTVLLKADDFKCLNEDKVKNRLGQVTSRGPYNRAFIQYVGSIKDLILAHFQQGGSASLTDITSLVDRSIQTADLVDDNGVDCRSDASKILTSYTETLLKKSGVIASGDKGLIKETKSRSYFSNESKFVLKSKKSDFLQSSFYQQYGQQFDSIAPILESRINEKLEAGLMQGQTGKMRMIVKDLKARPRKWVTENVSFKAKVASNRFNSFFSAESSMGKKEFYDATMSVLNAENVTDDADGDPLQQVDELRDQLSEVDKSASETIQSTSSSSSGTIDVITQQMSAVQSHIGALLNSDLTTQLLNIQGSMQYGSGDLESVSNQLNQSISSVESELTALKDILVGSGHIALDHVEDILMSVPYVGELYSALAVAKDVQGGYFAGKKMDAMKAQIETVTGFNRYVASDSLQTDQVSSNVQAFSTFMKAEQKRDAATFSLLFHVGNALSPPGVNVGSLLRSIKDVVSMPELADSDMDAIAQQVITINHDYTALARSEKSTGLSDVMQALDHDGNSLQAFTSAIYDVSAHLPTSDDFSAVLNDSLFT